MPGRGKAMSQISIRTYEDEPISKFLLERLRYTNLFKICCDFQCSTAWFSYATDNKCGQATS